MIRPLDKATICAPITAPGTAAVSIVRVSGEKSEEILKKLTTSALVIISRPREMIISSVYDLIRQNVSGEKSILDQALVCYFKAPHSYTGEDSIEFNLHGSSFLVQRLIENLLVCGARLAEPGEFSQRAFLNGQIDLIQAEAICDLIMAESEAQAQVANEQLEGKLSFAISDLGEPLRDILAEVEACLDFPEEDLPPISLEKWQIALEEIEIKIENHLKSFSAGRIYREGMKVAIVGKANAGKSSLLNRLVGEERAIVTAIPGTTRDKIEERINVNGLLVRLWDTAGLVDQEQREPDQIEKLGIKRSWKCAEEADLVIYLIDLSKELSQEEFLFEKVRALSNNILAVFNKVDLLPSSEQKSLPPCFLDPIYLSAKTGFNLDLLRNRIYELGTKSEQKRSSVVVTSQRHFNALKEAQSALSQARKELTSKKALELLSIDLRQALHALDEIIGVTPSEEILTRIFSKFCIGK